MNGTERPPIGVASKASVPRQARGTTSSAGQSAPLLGEVLSRERGEPSPCALQGTVAVDARKQFLAVLIAVFFIAAFVGGWLALLSLVGGVVLVVAHDGPRQ